MYRLYTVWRGVERSAVTRVTSKRGVKYDVNLVALLSGDLLDHVGRPYVSDVEAL